MTDGFPRQIGVYIHWPFCTRKCPYCDFNSHVRPQIDEKRFLRALVAELAFLSEEVPPGTVAGSVFFGGGTPSLMCPETVAELVMAVRRTPGLADDAEITLEANPGSAGVSKFREFASAGVNRISIGVQSLRDSSLSFLGRIHTARDGRKALEAAQETVPRCSIDLICALPGQTPQDWRTELGEALELAPEHLSVYQLTIEPGTPFFRQAQAGRLVPPSADTGAVLHDITAAMTGEAGIPAYEISNHARPGTESRHNLNYWRGGAWLGVGPGAHGRIPGGSPGHWQARRMIPDPGHWCDATGRHGHGTAELVSLTPGERAVEIVMTALRLHEGLPLETLERMTGVAADTVISPSGRRMLVDGGLLADHGEILVATARGRLLLDSVLGALVRTGGPAAPPR